MIHVQVVIPDIAIVTVRASGTYGPDIADDLTARAIRMLAAAAGAYRYALSPLELAPAEPDDDTEEAPI